MRRIVAIWAGVGVLIAVFWAIYVAMTFPAQLQAKPFLWGLAEITCPIAFASVHFHFGVKLYLAVAANAVTYALIGVIAETLRRTLHHA